MVSPFTSGFRGLRSIAVSMFFSDDLGMDTEVHVGRLVDSSQYLVMFLEQVLSV